MTTVSSYDTLFLVNEQSIGRNIRNIRESRGFTLTYAAEKAGVTKGTLSKIETGRVSSPISTLLRIAETLDVSVADFFTESEQKPAYILTRKNKGPIITHDGSQFGYSYEALALEMKGKTAEPFLLTIRPGDPAGTFRHGGQEFIYMLSGKMDFTLDGEALTLKPGDSLYFNPAKVHKTEVQGKTPARFLCVFIEDFLNSEKGR